jgi:DNA-binding MarR family transcriptional regulator
MLAAMKSPNARELTEFSMALYELVEIVRREHEGAAASVGLTAAQAAILTLLSEPVSMRALAKHMGCDASNITGIIDRLEARKLVVRREDSADRRVKVITQTAAGAAAIRKFQRNLVQLSALADLPAGARQELLKVLANVKRAAKS